MTPKFFHVAFFYTGLIFQLYSSCFYGNDVLVLVTYLDIPIHPQIYNYHFAHAHASGRDPKVRQQRRRRRRLCKINVCTLTSTFVLTTPSPSDLGLDCPIICRDRATGLDRFAFRKYPPINSTRMHARRAAASLSMRIFRVGRSPARTRPA